jgi:UDP-GlcNAc:undecaprenyl-phosphate GlcNAc-1-phosphate transferase
VREYVLTLLVTAAVTYILTPLVRRGAIKAGALHEARDRDVHVVPIPLLGGLAMYAGLAVGLLVAGQMSPLDSVLSGSNMATGLLLAGGLIVAMGVIDDRWGMNAISKLAGQVAAGVILVASGCELGWLPLPGGGTFSPTSNQALVLTVLVVVATINAVNFIDGLDGLAAGIVGIAAVSFFLYYYSLTHVLRLSAEAAPTLASALLAGMCLGFLPHNFFPARIFMGDTGSMLLGLLLAYAPISSITSLDPKTLEGTVNRFPEVLPLLLPTAILVIPYADMLMAVIRRTRAGMSPFAPDRKHLHHRLLDIGHSHRLSVLIMYLWAIMFSGLVVWFSTVRTPLFVFGVITLGAVLALLLMSMPRLRWWQRQRGTGLAPVAAGSVPVAVRSGGSAAAGAPVLAREPVTSARSAERHSAELPPAEWHPDDPRQGGRPPADQSVPSPARSFWGPARPAGETPAGRPPDRPAGPWATGAPPAAEPEPAGPWATGAAPAAEPGPAAPWANGAPSAPEPGPAGPWPNGAAPPPDPGPPVAFPWGRRPASPESPPSPPAGVDGDERIPVPPRDAAGRSRDGQASQPRPGRSPRSVVGTIPPVIPFGAPPPDPMNPEIPGSDALSGDAMSSDTRVPGVLDPDPYGPDSYGPDVYGLDPHSPDAFGPDDALGPDGHGSGGQGPGGRRLDGPVPDGRGRRRPRRP